MESRGLAWLGLFLLAASPAASEAAARPPSPFLDASSFLEMRGPEDGGDCLIATYSVRMNGSAGDQTFASCRDFIAVEEGAVTTVHDFRLERLIVIEDREATVTSMHALAYDRRAEMRDRRQFAAFARGRGVKPDPYPPVRQEASLQLPWSGDGYLHLERRREAEAEVFRHGEVEVARIRRGPAVPPSTKPLLRRALYLFFNLHPRVAEAVGETRAAPSFVAAIAGPRGEWNSVFILKELRVAPAPFPLTRSTALVRADEEIIDTRPALASALQRTIERGPAPSQTFDGMLRRIEQRLSEGDTFGALLEGHALMRTHEQEMKSCDRTSETALCARFRTALFAATQSDDVNVQAYLKAREAETRNLAAEGLDTLDSIDVAGREDAARLSFLRALLLVDLRTSGATHARYADLDTAIVTAFGEALAGDPAMTAALYEAGVERTRRGERQSAWVLFDAARAMPHFKGGLVDRIDGVERANRRILPYLFN